MTIKINIKSSKIKQEGLKAVGCKPDSVKRTDDLEKNKKTKKEEPIRTIVKTSKCKLKNINSPRHQLARKLTGSTVKDKVQVNKQKLDRLLAMSKSAANDEEVSEIDLDSLKRLLGVEAETVEEALIAGFRKRLAPTPLPEAMDNHEKKRRKKELNKKYSNQRKKMERDLPLSAINKDFMTLANGIAETESSKETDRDEDNDAVMTAFYTLQNYLDKKYGAQSTIRDKYKAALEEEEKKNCSVGNPNHVGPDSGTNSGQFTSKDDAGSWSLQWEKDRGDCEGGVAKMSGGNKSTTKKPCGRANKHGGKSKDKCG